MVIFAFCFVIAPHGEVDGVVERVFVGLLVLDVFGL